MESEQNMNSDTIQSPVRVTWDVGVRLDDEEFGTNKTWRLATDICDQWATELGLRSISAGTGFGVRDMQFGGVAVTSAEEQRRKDRLIAMLRDQGLTLEYFSVYVDDDNNDDED